MSKVTLETLKADFEDAAKSLWSKMQDGEGIEFAIRGTDQTHTFCLSSDSYVEPDLDPVSVLELLSGFPSHYYHPLMEHCRNRAGLYKIAKKDGIEAAMLWKLAN